MLDDDNMYLCFYAWCFLLKHSRSLTHSDISVHRAHIPYTWLQSAIKIHVEIFSCVRLRGERVHEDSNRLLSLSGFYLI